MEDCILCGVDDKNSTYIKNFGRWTLLVNYMQPTLGSTLLVLNRHVPSLSDITDEEGRDYWSHVRQLESVLRSAFNPSRINHLMLANAVQHAHYHIVPRYERNVSFGDLEWSDEQYGHTPKLTTDVKPQGLLDLVKEKILSNF